MKRKKQGKLWICLILILSFQILTGCEEIYVEKSSDESRQLIENWLAYKAQVEDTTKFAKELPVEERETQQTQQKQPYVIQQDDKPIIEGTVIQPLTEHGFYYLGLSDSLKNVYDEMLNSLLRMKQVTISTLSEEQADLAFQCVLNDHPEIFYVSGYHIIKKTMDGSTVELSFYGEYTLSKEEVEQRQKQIDAYIDTFFANLWNGMDEYEKVKAVYDYLITNTTYHLEVADNQNICSVFINGQSVCQGYAEASQYLLLKLGLEATVVTGKVSDGNRHAWNLVKVNGSYYYMDPTWGDADYRIVDETGNTSEEHLTSVNYDYFLVTTSQLAKTHQIDSVFPLPECVAIQDNYYVREKLFFETVDETQIEQAFQNAYANGQNAVTLKAANDMVFSELKEYMITRQKVFQYIHSTTTISYSEDAGMCTLCFWL